MIKLYHCRDRFKLCSERIVTSYHNSNHDLVTVSGTLNYIWNLWNSFWRVYFMLYALGGLDCGKNRILGFNNGLKQAQVAALYKRVYLHQRYSSQTVQYYSELTWGDPSVISKLLVDTFTSYPPALTNRTLSSTWGYVNSMLGIYSSDISDFQRIRNAFIHMNQYGLSSIEQMVLPRYRNLPEGKVINVLDSLSISTGQPCLRTLIDSMNGCLLSL